MILIWIALGVMVIMLAAFISMAVSCRRMRHWTEVFVNDRLDQLGRNDERLNTAICMDKTEMNKKIKALQKNMDEIIMDIGDIREEQCAKDVEVHDIKTAIGYDRPGNLSDLALMKARLSYLEDQVCTSMESTTVEADVTTDKLFATFAEMIADIQKDLRKLKKKVKAWEA